ncbi:hypothetical protein GCM10023205_52630 [Yinghuangia aomiensis]|uniref:Uncharacterized protein n=1 Tax=Yinghuangia aomiensis TaxID=676205 RepID=A0ABP9HTW3_9ACTN
MSRPNQARVHAQAVNDFEAAHGSPDTWQPWEREQFPRFVAAREAALMKADVTDPESMPGRVGVAR